MRLPAPGSNPLRRRIQAWASEHEKAPRTAAFVEPEVARRLAHPCQHRSSPPCQHYVACVDS